MRNVLGAGTIAMLLAGNALANDMSSAEQCLNLYPLPREGEARWEYNKNLEMCMLLASTELANELADMWGKPLDTREGGLTIFERRAAVIVSNKKPAGGPGAILIGTAAAIGAVLMEREINTHWENVDQARDAEEDAYASGDPERIEAARREREREEDRCMTCFNTDYRPGEGRVYDASHGHGPGGSHNTESEWGRRNR